MRCFVTKYGVMLTETSIGIVTVRNHKEALKGSSTI